MTPKDEWRSPPEILSVSRQAMGRSIDLDPASCAEANRPLRVGGRFGGVLARRFFDREADGLAKEWSTGALWLNPPFSNPKPWFQRVAQGWVNGTIRRGVVVVGDRAMSTEGGHALLVEARVLCIPQRRIRFLLPDGSVGASPNFGVVLAAGGRDLDVGRAVAAFSRIGTIWSRF